MVKNAVAVHQPNWYIGRTEPADWEQFIQVLSEAHPNLRQHVGAYSALGLMHMEGGSVRYVGFEGGGISMFEFIGYAEEVAIKLGALGFELLGGEFTGGHVGLTRAVLQRDLPRGVSFSREAAMAHLRHGQVAVPVQVADDMWDIVGRADQILVW